MNWLKNYERIIAIEQLLIWQPVTELDPRAYVPEVLYTPYIYFISVYFAIRITSRPIFDTISDRLC